MACLIIKEKGFETLKVPLASERTTLGRSKQCGVALRNKYVSGEHCEILNKDGECALVDLDSTNGLFVNGLRVKSKKLEDGDKILAGTALIIFVADEKTFNPKETIKQLRDGKIEEREVAATLLGHFGSTSAAAPLIKALKKDPESGVKAAAAEALGFLGSSKSVSAMLTLFDTADVVVRNSVVRALIRLADPAVIDGLAAHLKHADKAVRVLAAHALGQIHDQRVTKQLINALDDEAFVVRQAVVKALGDIADPRAAEALMRASADPEAFRQVWVIESLGKIRNPESIRIILDAMKSPDTEVREAAADALGKLLVKEAVPTLLDAIEDTDPGVRTSAASSLERLRVHLDIAGSSVGRSSASGRETIDISAIGDSVDLGIRKTPKFGEDRSKWEQWWAERAQG